MAANSQTVPMASADAGKSASDGVWRICLDRLKEAVSVQMLCRAVLAKASAKKSELSLPLDSGQQSEKFRKRPHDKIGFSFAWVCECGNFEAQRSATQNCEGGVERQCPACGAAERLAYVRLLCEPRNDTPAAPGKWVYPEVMVESSAPGEPSGRDYDWSHYDVVYYQDDRDPDLVTSDLANRA